MDKEYWDNFYKQKKVVHFPSTFAEFCLSEFIEKKSTIVELGSGNGRDAFYFAENGHHVYAIDQSHEANILETNMLTTVAKNNIDLITADFTKESFEAFNQIDVFYSRFTMHAIQQQEQDVLLPKLYSSLNKGGFFLVEARTTKDPLCGQGKPVGDNAYVTDHYRRFIDAQDFVKKCLHFGFNLLFFTEKSGLSVFNNDDPVLMRIALKK